MDGGWTDIAVCATAGDHAVQIYRSDDELVEFVAAYVVGGFEAAAPAVIVATPDHMSLFRDAISAHDWDPNEAERNGLLTTADAEETLASISVDGRPSAALFEEVVGARVDSIVARSNGRVLRAYGEMVDVLCRRNEPQAALALEELWCDFAQTRRFALLCSYGLDVFDREAQVSPIPSICQSHTHVLPAWDVERLTLAVDHALERVLGTEQSQKVHALVGSDARRRRIPVAQLTLMWISSHMPVLANRVLAVAREHYESGAVAA